MNPGKKDIFVQLLLISLLFITFVGFLTKGNQPQNVYPLHTAATSPTPTPFNPFPYKPPKIAYSRAYLTMLVGDSIVGSLGPNSQLLRQHLIEFYPDHEFVNYNYGFGATSIETLPDRLMKTTIYEDQSYPPILSQGFDLIIIESFGYNPLSQLAAGEGLAKHLSILDNSIKTIIQERPETVVAILTPIPPNRAYFAKGVYDLSDFDRERWANERIAYIEAVIEYAETNNIPLINVYTQSKTAEGDGNLKYINPDDYIHPSLEGIDLMSKSIAEFIFSNKIFPK